MTSTLCFILGVANSPPLKIISQVDKENYRGAPGGAPIFTRFVLGAPDQAPPDSIIFGGDRNAPSNFSYFKLRMFFIEIYIILVEQEIARFRK